MILLVSCGKPEGSSVIFNKNVSNATTINTNLYTDSNNQVWIPLHDAVKGINLHMKMDKKAALIGYSDVMYRAEPNSSTAMSLGHAIKLSHAPMYHNNKMYMTPEALSELLQTNIIADTNEQAIQIKAMELPSGDAYGTNANQNNGKFKTYDVSQNRDKIVDYAKQFLGVPYEFGAPPYEDNKTFDCSSFTRHIFKRFGSDLPRLAREQGREGIPVSRDELLIGDLLFFTVPGRFENDKIPGHVGMYIGNGKMIHTWGDPGVQISSIDTGYWHDVLLFMRRVQ